MIIPKFKSGWSVKLKQPVGYDGEDNNIGTIVRVKTVKPVVTYIVETQNRTIQVDENNIEYRYFRRGLPMVYVDTADNIFKIGYADGYGGIIDVDGMTWQIPFDEFDIGVVDYIISRVQS